MAAFAALRMRFFTSFRMTRKLFVLRSKAMLYSEQREESHPF